MTTPDGVAGRKGRPSSSSSLRVLALVLNLVLVASGIWLIAVQYTVVGLAPAGRVPEVVVRPSPEIAPASGIPAGEVDNFQRSYVELSRDLSAETGLVVWPVGASAPSMVLGELKIGPAWSTMKVPLSIAAVRHGATAADTEAIEAAITRSDNDSADFLWQRLGDPQTAAASVQDVLRSSGDEETVVQSERIHPPFSAFGQTMWTLENQTRFLASAACEPADAPVLELMGQVESDQRWGLGHLTEVKFKGGWGPSMSGKYLVRQMGLISTEHGLTAVAIAAAPSSGSFDDGTRTLTVLAEWLAKRVGELPAGRCP